MSVRLIAPTMGKGKWGLRLTAFGLIAASPALAAAPRNAIGFPILDATPESITSTSDGTIYAGSISNGGVFRIAPGQTMARAWIKPGALGTRSTLGVLADERSGVLWVCSNDLAELGIKVPGNGQGSTLTAWDLKTAHLRLSRPLPVGAMCNDMAIDRSGSIYITNMAQPQILRLRHGGAKIEVWVQDERFNPEKGGDLDGIAIAGDGSIIVNVFTRGELFRVTPSGSGAPLITQLTLSRPLQHPDGMRAISGNTFILAEGGGRADMLTVSGDKVVVDTLRDRLTEPTSVTKSGSTIWVTDGPSAFVWEPRKPGSAGHVAKLIPVSPLQPRPR